MPVVLVAAVVVLGIPLVVLVVWAAVEFVLWD